MPFQAADPDDPRWEGSVPLFLRNSGPLDANWERWDLFFSRVGHRLDQLVLYNEPKIQDRDHFGDQLASATHLLFSFDRHTPLHKQLDLYFRPKTMAQKINEYLEVDIEYKNARSLWEKQFGLGLHQDASPYESAEYKSYQNKKHERNTFCQSAVVKQRLTVLEEILGMVRLQRDGASAFPRLVKDIRRYMAVAGIALDISSSPVCIRPLDQAMLDREVIQRLLPMLSESHPDLERDLVSAYHDFLQGTDSNTVFGNAFKILEELAKRIAKEEVRLSDDKALTKHFGKLHPTIHATIIKLAAHRGKEGGHHRQGPDDYEMRYLLFSVCNCALLFLEYESKA